MTVSPELTYDSTSYSVITIKANPDNLKNFQILQNTQQQNHKDFVINSGLDNSFYINASIVDSSCRPIGLCVSNGSIIQKANLSHNGTGNFYQLKSAALIISNDQAHICYSEAIANYTSITFGIQSGPMLISHDSISPEFDKNSTHKNFRCGVGIFTSKSGQDYLVFCKSKEEVSFYKFANLFRSKFKCSAATCLESGTVCAFGLPGIPPENEEQSINVCNYIYYHE
jgi:uncharacterized protein YigE (DUF2233 family)